VTKSNLKVKISKTNENKVNNVLTLCATVAFKAANAAEAASGRTFSFEEWHFYFNLNNAACLAMQ